MNLPQIVKIAKLKANGLRFIVVAEKDGKVRCKGEVQRLNGMSALHGRDRVFLTDRVEIAETDYSRELLEDLHRESTYVLEEPKPLPKPKAIREPGAPKRRKWAKREWDSYEGKHRWMLTSHARSQLFKMGKGMAEDGLGNYLDEDSLGDAAMDTAAYIYDLTQDGVPEGFNNCREAAADYIYEGMCKALDQAKKEGRKTTLEKCA